MQKTLHIIACGLAGLRAALFSFCAILFAACDGIGTSVRGSYELYGVGSTSPASGTSPDASAGHFSTKDLLELSNAGDAEAIVDLFLGVKGLDSSSPEGMVTVALPATAIKLPAGGRVTLTITGGGLNYEDTAEASDDGMVYFQVPKVQNGSVLKVSLTVKKANGRLYCSGSKTQTVRENSNNFGIALKYEPIPVSMLTGSQINTALKGAFSVTAGGTAMSFCPSQTPPPAGASTTLLSTADSECELFAWQEGDAILFYAEGMEGGGKIPLSADSKQMFDGCSALTAIDMSCFDTRDATAMHFMFRNCSSLTALNLHGWDTGKVTDMHEMFSGCSSLVNLDASSLDTGSVTNMMQMFNGCTSLSYLDTSGWDTSRVTDMHFMFRDCSSLTALDVRNWDTSNVTDMRRMFDGCSSLTSLDAGSWNTGKVTNIFCMFYNCTNLSSVNVRGWDTGCVADMNSMFANCISLTSVDVSGWNTSNVTAMHRVFQGCSGLIYVDVSGWNTEKVETINSMFQGCSCLETIYASGSFSLGAVTSGTNMFRDCSSLVGGAGTVYDYYKRHSDMARMDNPPSFPGYFTLKTP